MSPVEDIAQALQEHPFFKDFSADGLAELQACASMATFAANDYIYREHQTAARFYLITLGRVALEVHIPGQAPIIVDTLRSGDVLGWSWLIPPYETHFDARALELTRTLCLDAPALRERMEQNHSLGYAVHKRIAPIVASRLAAARRQLIDVYGLPEQRGTAWQA